MGECRFYGVQNLNLCPQELSSNMFVKWRRIRYEVVEQMSNGKDKKAPKALYNETPPRELISYIKPRTHI
jgi:hypothetical protein